MEEVTFAWALKGRVKSLQTGVGETIGEREQSVQETQSQLITETGTKFWVVSVEGGAKGRVMDVK